ncbi:MAG: hypothetical protein KAI66_18885 [Lentisphaeria bacterium]|nr:hypothetical protein [Lentisphaeria bacterium]
MKFRSRFRSLKPGVVFAYYRSSAPDLLDEFEMHCRNRAVAKADKTLNGMARHYLRLEQVRRRSADEYARLVELDTLDYQARVAGKRIIQLGRLAARGEMTEDRTAELERTRKELARKLADSFAHAHDNQLVEITRLEVELKSMRDLLERRAANRETILRRRYFKLCGEDAEESFPFAAKDVSMHAEKK